MAADRTISSLRAGDEVRGVYACVRKDRLKTRTGSAYLALELRDRTGSVQARAFRDADVLAGRFERGDLVSVVGRVERFRDDLVVEVTDIRSAQAEGDGADQVAALEAAGQRVGIAERAGLHAAGAVAQLERQVRAAGAGLQPVLAHARVDAAHLIARAQGTYGPIGRHTAMMYGDSDAATQMELPTGSSAGSCADLWLQGLERRRRRGVIGRDVRGRRTGSA